MNRLAVGWRVTPWLAGLLLAAVLVPEAYSPSPRAADSANVLGAPSWSHPLGTDRHGRDCLSRAVHGGRRSLVLAVVAETLALALGSVLGLVAAFFARTPLDTAIRVAGTVVLAVPLLLLAMAVSTIARLDGLQVVLVVGLAGWVYVARLVRAETIRLRKAPFVLAARSYGIRDARILATGILPNLGHVLVPIAVSGIADIIAIEAGLAFLGVGVQGTAPSLGAMLAEGRAFLPAAWWMTLAPCLALVGIVASLTVLAGGTVGTLTAPALEEPGP